MLQEVALMLVRSAVTARSKGLTDDANRIDRALAALISLDEDDEIPTSSDKLRTKMGLGSPELPPVDPHHPPTLKGMGPR